MSKNNLLQFGKNLVPVDLSDFPEVKDEKIFVRSLSSAERLILDEVREGSPTKTLGDHEWCYLGACDENGKRYFTVEEVKQLDGRLAAKIGVAVVRVSGLSRNALETAEKKSDASPSSDSP